MFKWSLPTRRITIEELAKEQPDPVMDAVIADTIAKIKSVPMRGPFPARRKARRPGAGGDA